MTYIVFLPKVYTAVSNHEETLDQLKLRGILQNVACTLKKVNTFEKQGKADEPFHIEGD